jgi:hypothetical protein
MIGQDTPRSHVSTLDFTRGHGCTTTEAPKRFIALIKCNYLFPSKRLSGVAEIELFMNPRPFLRVALLFSLTALAAAQNQVPRSPEATPSVQATPTPLPQNANDYIRQVIQNELTQQENDHSHFRYFLHREDDKGSQDRDVIETREGSLSRTLLKFGRPLTTEEREQDDERIQKQLSDPSERAKHLKREREDADKAKQMLKAIPDAFIFKYGSEENGLVGVTFTPNPHYNAPNRELQVFRSLGGTIWIDRANSRMARIEGSLFEDVSFGLGLLGRLNKGGTFLVVQKQVAPAHWEPVSMDINITGRAVIFKTINVKQRQRFTEFRRVSDSLTLAQAYEMLKKDPNPVSADNHAAVHPPQD